ncbi:MAG: carboxypeptidase regulatory-like domain-containing protein [Thermoplasmata archaeon]|nr:carboxypeptidase regulatory-like domain-containing protein [Thermoplasmata archaeon]
MDWSETGWWRRHVWTVVILLTAFTSAILIRSLWTAQIIQQWGPLYVYGGGSDSFYHSRVSEYIVLNHHNLVRDPLLNYPNGAVNPREPLFDWMNAILGILFAGLFHGSAANATAWFLDAQGPIWAALGVFPVYLIGREVSSRRTGLVAAMIYPLLVANIDSSTLGYANYLSFYTFFILLTVYGYLRTVRAVGSRKWVEDYRHPRQFLPAIRQFVRVERTAVKWAFFTGVCFGTVALAWQGYSFVVAAIIIFVIVAMIIERIRRVDSFGLYVSTWIVGLVGFPMAVPYYVPQGLFTGWFDLPLLVFFGGLLVMLPFLVLRDQPWVVSIPVLAAVVAGAVGALYLIDKASLINIVTGQGYFVKTLVYSTVAEAQAPSIDALILGYGIVTFFLAFVGLALTVWGVIRGRFRRPQLMFLVFAVISIYLPISAAKFFFLGSAAFALLPAEAIVRALDIGNYTKLRRNVASLSDRRSQFTAFRKSIKARHIAILVLVVGLLLPNIWYAIDAGIPYNTKSTYNQQIYHSLPSFLQTSASNASSFYLGAAGTQLDTPNQYDEAGYNWLAQQDQNLPAPQRPAFISWWDYGFQAVSQGLHPTVADNFQNGIVPAGNFLLSQNESQAIGILTTTLLVAEQKRSGDAYLPTGLDQLLARDGVNLTTLHTLMVNTSRDIPIVIAHPERYVAVDPNHLDAANALYDTVSYLLASRGLNPSALVYNDVQAYTGWSIRYAMVDNRLFPFSGSNTGIFYAPADLTDRQIGSDGSASAYYTLSATGSDGNSYPVNHVPAGISIVQYNINWLPAFYQTMIYKIFIGYNGTQIGAGGGIPGLTGAAASSPIEPGWMLQHFRVVYKTAYYCPYANPNSHPGCFGAQNLPTAVTLAHAHNGTADTSPNAYFQGGESMLEYYSGQPMTGTVQLADGTPVSSARVTVYDSWGIPHMTTLSGPTGAYSVLLPPGNVTINVTAGPLDGISQAGTSHLGTIHLFVPDAYGLATDAPTVVRPIVLPATTVQGIVYWNAANNSSYIPHLDPLAVGATVSLYGAGLSSHHSVTDASGAFVFTDIPAGVYNFSVLYQGANFTETKVYALPGQVINQTTALRPGQVNGIAHYADESPANGATVRVVSSSGNVVGSATANGTGGFQVGSLVPGNYTVSASLGTLASAPSAVSISAAGGKSRVNLTLVPVETVDLTVVSGGNPVAGFPVRFSTLPNFGFVPVRVTNSTGHTSNSTTLIPVPGSGTTPTSTNSTTFLTGADGTISAVLPVGNYSVYGLGLLGSTLEAGFEDAYVTANPGGFPLPPLFVAPAVELHGALHAPATNVGAAPTLVTLFNARGEQVSTFSNSSSSYVAWLPPGTYTVLAGEGLSAAGTSYAQLTTVTLRAASQTLDLALVPAIRVNAVVGLATFSGTTGYYPAVRAAVSVSVSPSGATISTLSNSTGNISLVLPGTLSPASTYCLTVAAAGYDPYSSCGLSPSSLSSLTAVPLSVTKVPVEVDVLGLPSGTSLNLNLTANSSTAQSVSTTGGPTFSLSLRPGSYRISAYATVSNGSALYLPSSISNTYIPFGSQQTNITLLLLREVRSTGELTLPANVSNSSVTLHLSSAQLNLTVSGPTFEGRFFAAPGTYRVYAVALSGNNTFSTITTTTINATGAIAAPLVLTASGSTLSGNLTRPEGMPLNATFPFTLTGPYGLSIPLEAFSGRYSVVVPTGDGFTPSVDTVQLVSTASGSQYESFHAASGTTCTATSPLSECNIPLTASAIQTSVSIQLRYGSFPSLVSGVLQLIGPAPSLNVTTLNVSSGSVTVTLTPGTYQVYAVGGSGAPIAAVTSLVAPPSGASSPFVVTLVPAWTVSVTVTSGSPGLSPTANLWFRQSTGLSLAFHHVPIGTSVSYLLPAGIYTLQANASGRPYGVVTNATATASVDLLSGNTASSLSVSYKWRQTASFQILGPNSATVVDGNWVAYSFSLRNTGNVPYSYRLIGTPSFWTFDFTPANGSLGVLAGNNTVFGEVRILIPAGTAVAHPTINLEVLTTPDGTVAGFANPTPTLNIVPYVGLTIGEGAVGTFVLSPTSATLPFYLLNTGNVPEAIALSIQDGARVSGLGWSYQILQGKSVVNAPQTVQAGANQSFFVHLTAPTGAALPPGSVTVSAHVLNLSGTLVRLQPLAVPELKLSLNSTTVLITGPNIGSPPTYPDWLVPLLSFLPAVALVIGVATWRWYRTRRWTRR